jgi:hypothetical protein
MRHSPVLVSNVQMGTASAPVSSVDTLADIVEASRVFSRVRTLGVKLRLRLVFLFVPLRTRTGPNLARSAGWK